MSQARIVTRTKLQENLEKLYYLFLQADAVRSIGRANITDADKRAFLRFFFVVIDNLLKISPQVKNLAYKLGTLKKSDEEEFKRLIKVIEASYTGSYDTIRDKLSAHQQNLPLEKTISWWAEIDSISIDVLGDDLRALRAFMMSKGLSTGPELTLDEFPAEFTSEKKFLLNVGRFGLGTEGAVSMIPGHESQEKAAMVASAIDFLKKDFWLTACFDNPKTLHYLHIFNVGWLLSVIDFISLLDCIYNDDKEKSLVTIWREANIAGVVQLESIPRNENFEVTIRAMRNKVAAHLDVIVPLAESLKLFYGFDIKSFHQYVVDFVNGFLEACRSDIRTMHIVAHNQELKGVLALSNEELIKRF